MTGQDARIPTGAIDKTRLVEDNMGFVVAMAKQYSGKGVPLDDLVSEGYIGLIKAAEKYDGTKGAKFVSYAAGYVRNCILQALSDNDRKYNDSASTRIETMTSGGAPTDSRAEQGAATADIVSALDCLNGRERNVIIHCFGIDGPQMTFAEIGEKLGMSRERVRQIRKKALRHLRKNAGTTETKTFLY